MLSIWEQKDERQFLPKSRMWSILHDENLGPSTKTYYAERWIYSWIGTEYSNQGIYLDFEVDLKESLLRIILNSVSFDCILYDSESGEFKPLRFRDGKWYTKRFKSVLSWQDFLDGRFVGSLCSDIFGELDNFLLKSLERGLRDSGVFPGDIRAYIYLTNSSIRYLNREKLMKDTPDYAIDIFDFLDFS